MPKNEVTFPTHAGRIVIEFGAAGPVHTWRGPEVYFSVDGLPAVSVVMEDGEAVVDVMGTDPRTFDALPEDLQLAAAWWQLVLPHIAETWRLHAAGLPHDDLRDAA